MEKDNLDALAKKYARDLYKHTDADKELAIPYLAFKAGYRARDEENAKLKTCIKRWEDEDTHEAMECYLTTEKLKACLDKIVQGPGTRIANWNTSWAATVAKEGLK